MKKIKINNNSKMKLIAISILSVLSLGLSGIAYTFYNEEPFYNDNEEGATITSTEADASIYRQWELVEGIPIPPFTTKMVWDFSDKRNIFVYLKLDACKDLDKELIGKWCVKDSIGYRIKKTKKNEGVIYTSNKLNYQYIITGNNLLLKQENEKNVMIAIFKAKEKIKDEDIYT